ncbi:phytase [Geodermatophilus sp. YIM 151500]|uniref:phytase n=1 Tax=Geodermatophilus sp. YIM 151500 TaxID=2984531 RepID=UPI0021E40463|nr:phytase [Geodermatophilus sp. YIM 151500]MCV2491112.1 phytase [Geodermatophilus sp. YIM 151500]
MDAPVRAQGLAPGTVNGEVRPTVETEPVPSDGDAADDPAVWVNPDDPTRSAVIATDKKSGLLVYDLDGSQLQYLPEGEFNNVDVRTVPGRSGPLVVAGERSGNAIGVFELEPGSRQLRNVSAGGLEPGVEVYGSCLYLSPDTGRLYVFVTSKSGDVEQWELVDDGSGRVAGQQVRTFALDSQTEGCVADDEVGQVYVSEEAVGIWKLGAEPGDPGEGTLVAEVADGGPLAADVEGLTLTTRPDGTGYLIASSQGNDSLVVYAREGDNPFVLSFRILGGMGVDGVTHADGVDAVAADLGPAFPSGVLVVQDSENDEGNQNFKLVPLDQILPG